MKPWWIHPGALCRLLYKQFYETDALNKRKRSLVVLHLQNYAAGINGDNHQSSASFFYYPKKSLPKSSYPKKYLPNSPPQKKSRNRTFQTQKILRSSPSLELRSTSPHPQFSLGLHGRLSARAMRSFLSRFPHAKSLYMSKWRNFLIL